MEIRILGAHSLESSNTRMTSLLIDGVMAVDAGALTSTLSFEEQKKLKYILLTHHHYDHIRDVAAVAINFANFADIVRIYAQSCTLDAISDYMLNGTVYPKFNEVPTPDNPPVEFNPLLPDEPTGIGGYEVLAVPVKHSIPTIGYQISTAGGKSFFYSGDTGPGVTACLESISPQMIILDMSLPDRMSEDAVRFGHLTPRLMVTEMTRFKEIKGYLPQIVLVHINPIFEDEIKRDVESLSGELDTKVTLGREGMTFKL